VAVLVVAGEDGQVADHRDAWRVARDEHDALLPVHMSAGIGAVQET
jgi:hypothetical protein